jgi:heme-degrading monooxygenase HmoA
MLIQIVRYKSGLSHEEVVERFQARTDAYRSVPGLLQKYYVQYPTGEYGGVYVWDSRESLTQWRETRLAGTLEETYHLTEPLTVELADVVLVLHER